MSEDRATRYNPRNLEAEMALLGALLVQNRVYDRVQEIVKPQHFFSPSNGMIYDAIRTMLDRGQMADPVTLMTHLQDFEEDEIVGGGGYVAELAASVITVQNAPDLAREIYDCYVRRELIEYADQVQDRATARDYTDTADEQLEAAEAMLTALRRRGSVTGPGDTTLRSHLEAAYASIEDVYRHQGRVRVGLSTGIRNLDAKVMTGMRDGHLIIIAGRPAMGKSALATNIAYNVAAAVREVEEEGVIIETRSPVGIWSLEMAGEELATRLLGEHSNVSAQTLTGGVATEEQMHRMFGIKRQLSNLPLFIDDTGNLSPTQLRSRALMLKREHGLSLIVVDYLQLMEPPDRQRRYQSRIDEITEISRALKNLARELEVPVIALSQLNRGVESRDDKRPRLSDLRESGAIEQDADQIWMVYRPEYYLAQEEPQEHTFKSALDYDEAYSGWMRKLAETRGKAEVNIVKYRGGKPGMARLWFNPELTRFTDEPEPNGPAEDDQQAGLDLSTL